MRAEVLVFQRILADLKVYGKSDICPANLFWKCTNCKNHFPRIRLDQQDNGWDCPCYSYTPKHLIRKVKQIIKEIEE